HHNAVDHAVATPVVTTRWQRSHTAAAVLVAARMATGTSATNYGGSVSLQKLATCGLPPMLR
ncbi:MAG: hypothetical protein M3443_12710, partial [Actinomycetota bacterium]|nr:hypothetical protein [Actinomycetota bacterium]